MSTARIEIVQRRRYTYFVLLPPALTIIYIIYCPNTAEICFETTYDCLKKLWVMWLMYRVCTKDKKACLNMPSYLFETFEQKQDNFKGTGAFLQ